MTREEFELQYAKNGGTIVSALRGLGLYAISCNCAGEDCLGWQMRNLKQLLLFHVRNVEHIPDDWDWMDLEADLIAEGETELLQMLRMVAGRNAYNRTRIDTEMGNQCVQANPSDHPLLKA